MANRIKLAGTTSPSFQIGLQKVTLDTSQVSNAYSLLFPPNTGTANQLLQTNGTGTLSWVNPYTLTSASTSILGGVKVDGTSITINSNGIINANYPTTLAGLTDVNIPSPGNNQVLTYNTATNKWIPTTVNGVNTLPTGIAYYGSFYDTTTQSFASATTDYIINIGIANENNNGININNGNQITFSYAGTFNISTSLQLLNTDNKQADFYVWYRLNGTDIVDSSNSFTVAARASANVPVKLVTVSPITVTINAGDYIQIVINSPNSNVTVSPIAASTNPVIPVSPGVDIQVMPVTQLITPTTVQNLTAVGNISANNFIAAYMSIVSSGTITSLTSASPHYISVSGVSTQTIKLPDATLLTLGQSYKIDNNSTGIVYLQDGSGNPISNYILPGGTTEERVTNIGSIAGTWDGWNFVPSNVQWGTNTLTFAGGTISSSVFIGNLIGTSTNATTILGSTQTNIKTIGTLTGLTSSGIININYIGNSDSALTITGSDTKGGNGYHDFLRATNGYSGATNPTKFFRINNTGGLEILNNSYSATIFSISDVGIVGLPTANSTNQIPNNYALALGGHSYIFDDGNMHLTANDGNIWINANNGGDVKINTQSPASGGLTVGGNITSNTTGVGHSFFAKVQSTFSAAFDTTIAMDNLNIRVHLISGNTGQLQASAVSGSFTSYVSLVSNIAGQSPTFDTNSSGITFTVGSWSSAGASKNIGVGGDMIIVHFIDTSNSRIYRVTAVHCQNATAYISIERMC